MKGGKLRKRQLSGANLRFTLIISCKRFKNVKKKIKK
jgi:hypothetical protein